MIQSFDDRMFEFAFEHEKPTGDILLKALAEFPGEEREVYAYFQSWVWLDWSDANLPHVESTEEEVEEFVNQGMMLFYEKLAEREGRLAEAGKC